MLTRAAVTDIRVVTAIITRAFMTMARGGGEVDGVQC